MGVYESVLLSTVDQNLELSLIRLLVPRRFVFVFVFNRSES